jgi:hypothetical protein
MVEENEDYETVKEAPALPEALVATPANCTGELLQLPAVEGVTYNSYECQTCGQTVHVGYEDLAENGLPAEHSPVVLLQYPHTGRT